MFCKIKPVVDNLNDKSAKTILFAAWELQKYLELVIKGDFPVIHTNKYVENDKDTIYLGVALTEKLEKADDKDLDDNIFIDIDNFNGVITGTNPRSVLIGVYRFLKEKGYKFIRPGKAGEIIPESIDGSKVFVSEKASNRYRGWTIEGSVYQENLMDTIDWIPKVGMNGYFVQFQIPYVFFDRYYQDSNGDIKFLGEHRKSHSISPDEVAAMIELLEIEIEKRDLQYHSMGHGWTNKVFGIDAISWEAYDGKVTEEQTKFMAQVDGKRGLHSNTPMCTQLCLSNAVVRDKLTDVIIDHLESHKNITHLHFWLADGAQNYCECDECKKLRPSDWYVMTLNELDEKLTAKGMDTRIVFIVWSEVFWVPIKERLNNPSRFVLCLAPITRTFSAPLDRDENVKTLEYNLNNQDQPKSGPENIAYLDEWTSIYDGDCVNFDYYFTWDHYFEFSQYQLSDLIYKDFQNYKNLNLDGIISCQIQRAFIPTSLGMNVLARTLWNKETPYETIERETLSAEFGKDYKKVIDYLKEISEHNCAKVIRCEMYLSDDGVAEDLAKTAEILDGFEPEILAQIENENNPQIKDAWERLHFHNRLYRKMVEYYINYHNPDNEKLEKEIYDFAKKHEARFKDVFDAYYFCWTFQLLIKQRLNRIEVIK